MVPRLLLLAAVAAGSPVDASYAVYADKYCFGEGENACVCNPKGKAGDDCTKAGGNDLGLNYGYLGADSLPTCQAKCEEMGCQCFDHTETPARPNENCRICKPGQSFRPLHDSGAGCSAFLYQPQWGWSVVCFILGVVAAYVAGGYVYGTQIKGRRGRGALPHAQFWLEVDALVRDGARFVAAAGRAPHPRSVRRQTQGPPQTLQEPLSSETKKRRSGGEKTRGEKRGQSKSASRSTDMQNAPSASQPALPPQPPQQGTGSLGKATASGGGGRWVHVPN